MHVYTLLLKPQNFRVQSLRTRLRARGRSTKGKGFFLSLFVSRLYIRVCCLRLIIDIELNSNWRQKEKLSKKKKIAEAVIRPEQPRRDRCVTKPAAAAVTRLLFA